MKLPHQEQAYIQPRKLIDYLLSPAHPAGRSKAIFFRRAGFDDANAHLLEQALVEIAHTCERRKRRWDICSKALSEACCVH